MIAPNLESVDEFMHSLHTNSTQHVRGKRKTNAAVSNLNLDIRGKLRALHRRGAVVLDDVGMSQFTHHGHLLVLSQEGYCHCR